MDLRNKENNETIESKISSVIMKLHRQIYGRGPLSYKLYLVDDLIVIKYKGILSETEREIAKRIDGAEMIKNLRRRAFDINIDKVKIELENILNRKVLNVFFDIIPDEDKKITIFTLQKSAI